MDWLKSLGDIVWAIFLLALVFAIIGIVIVVWVDNSQKKHAVLRNYPFIGHFRYIMESAGEFFRQYFFALDREELPFNRSQRSWIYRSAKNVDNTVAFGSTKELHEPGTFIFLNSCFPVLEDQVKPSQPMVIGPYARHPYETHTFYNISAMSFGAISNHAVIALSGGAKKAGCWLNTGEGGLSSYHLSGGSDIVFQIGTAKYGVRNADGGLDLAKLKQIAANDAVKMFEIKLSQGAKPGKGGILPAAKVTAEIASIRGIPEGKSSISPNRHPELNSAPDLLDMVARVREVTGKPVGVKFVLGDDQWLQDIFKLVLERGKETAMDYVVVDGGEGGTGAAPLALMDSVGLPLWQALPRVVDLLKEYGLRERIKVVASGKLVTATNVAAALAFGADYCNSARGFMFALGCLQSLQCNKNTCPAGVATQNPDLIDGLVPEDKIERVYHFHKNMEKEVAIIAHSCGVHDPRHLERKQVNMVLEGNQQVNLANRYPDVAV